MAGRGVLIYLRVSTEEQAQAGNSLAEQERRIREKFERRLGLPILGVYADEGASAYKDDERREQFWRMIERAKGDPQVGIIAVDEESRFYRNRYRAAAIKAELLECGVTVQTARSDYDPRTLAGLWMQAIEETMAHAGSLQNREYTMRAMAGNVRARDPETGWAWKNGGAPPYGYRAVRVETGRRDRKGRAVVKVRWEVDPEPASVLRRIFAWRLEGRSYQWIRDKLNGEGVPSPRGAGWRSSTLHTLLSEDYILTYAGYGLWNKHYRKGPRPRGVQHKPREEWVVEPRAHPAILDEATAERLIALARATRERHAPGHAKARAASAYLLTGPNLDEEPMLRCAACGGHLIGSAHGTMARRRRKYVCAEARYSGRCRTVWVDAEGVERAILDHVRRHYLTEDYVRAVAAEVHRLLEAESREDPAAELRKRLAEAERQIANVRAVILAGGDPQMLAADLNRLVAAAETLRGQLAQASRARQRIEVSEERALQWLSDALRAMDEGDLPALRQLIRAFVRSVTLDPDRRRLLVEFLPDPRSESHPAALLLPVHKREALAPPAGFEPASHG